MGITIFLSYATKDSNRFQIAQIAKLLEEDKNIDKVWYWEQDMVYDIIKYMNDSIAEADIVILFCSKNSLESRPIAMEWQAAFSLKKIIIPVFFDKQYIPPLLKTLFGIEWSESDLKRNVENLIDLIYKKMALRIKSETIEEEMEIQPPFEAYCGKKSFIFISYSHKDKKEVYPIIEQLREKGIRIWYDEGIPPSDNYMKTIALSIKKSNGFVLFITPNVNNSKYVSLELQYAYKLEKKIVPVYLQETELAEDFELTLILTQDIKKYLMDEEKFYKKMISTLKKLLKIPLEQLSS